MSVRIRVHTAVNACTRMCTVELFSIHVRCVSTGQSHRLEQQIGTGHVCKKLVKRMDCTDPERREMMKIRIIPIGGHIVFCSKGSSVGGEDRSRRLAAVPVRESTHRHSEALVITSFCAVLHTAQ
jgi:hypothetical protein